MSTMKSALRRAAAGAGALALALAGAMAMGTAASAAGFTPPDPDVTGTLTLHKHVRNSASTPGYPAGDPLEGVVFSIQEVGTMVDGACTALNLGTPAGWEAVSTAITDFNETTGALPSTHCLIGTAENLDGTTSAGTTSKSGLRGLYVVKEVSPGGNMISEPAAPFLVTVPMPVTTADPVTNMWNFDVHAYPKNVLTTTNPTKTVGTANVDAGVVPGALVPWEISVPVPVAAFPYTTISITDLPQGTGHTFDSFVSIRLGGTDLDGPLSAVLPTDPDGYDYTVTDDIITLTARGLAKVNAIAVTGNPPTEATITVALKTKVSENIDPSTLTNKANVTLNGTTTPTNEPKSYWGEIVVTKHVAGNVEAKLQNAKFSVYEKGDAGTCAAAVTPPAVPVASGTTDTDGVFSQVLWIANAQATDDSVKTKVYCLVETEAPDGYLLDATPREFTLSTENTAFQTSLDFPNTQPEGPGLPLTGAEGTLAMTIGGLLLVGAGTGAIVVSRRRHNAS